MRVQNANEARDDFERYGRALHAVVAKNLDLFWRPAGTCEETASPATGRIRGRIVAFECAPPQFGLERIDGRQWAVPWHGNRSLFQDDWDGPEIAMKLEEIRRLHTDAHPPGRWFSTASARPTGSRGIPPPTPGG